MTNNYTQLNTLRSYRTTPVLAHKTAASAKKQGLSESEFVRQAIEEAIDRLQNNKPLNTNQGGL